VNYLLIAYDPATAHDGKPIDLMSYLENEFNNCKIVTVVATLEPDEVPEELR
jgi:hypothetical protein